MCLATKIVNQILNSFALLFYGHISAYQTSLQHGHYCKLQAKLLSDKHVVHSMGLCLLCGSHFDIGEGKGSLITNRNNEKSKAFWLQFRLKGK